MILLCDIEFCSSVSAVKVFMVFKVSKSLKISTNSGRSSQSVVKISKASSTAHNKVQGVSRIVFAILPSSIDGSLHYYKFHFLIFISVSISMTLF